MIPIKHAPEEKTSGMLYGDFLSKRPGAISDTCAAPARFPFWLFFASLSVFCSGIPYPRIQFPPRRRDFLFSEAKKRCAVFSFSAHLPGKCSTCFRVFCLAPVRIMRSYDGKYPKINENIENISKLFFQPGQVLSGLTVIIKTWGQNRCGDGAALTQIHTSRKGEKAKRKSKGKMKPKAKPASRPQKSREQKNAASR